MNIVWLTWKDLKHPLAGGAEVVNEELAKRLVKNGHTVTLLVGGFKGGKPTETINGYKVIRVGNRYTVYIKACLYYLKHLRGQADLVIDEVNTVPFFAKFYAGKPVTLFYHQLSRQIWFCELPKFIGWIGYIGEPIYTWLFRNNKAIAMSNSTKQDLMRYGFKAKNITVVSEGIDIKPLASLSKSAKKYKQPTLLSLASVRSMKRTLHQVQAFEIAKDTILELQLIVAGSTSGSYGAKVVEYINNSRYKDSIQVWGRVTVAQKLELWQKCHIFISSPVKEGWNLVVTEANSQGTPAVGYNVDGLRDSIKHNKTGIICDPNPAAMAKAVVGLLNNKQKYDKIRSNAYEFSKTITFEQSYKDFCKSIGISR